MVKIVISAKYSLHFSWVLFAFQLHHYHLAHYGSSMTKVGKFLQKVGKTFFSMDKLSWRK